MKLATQLKGKLLPLVDVKKPEKARAITEEERKVKCYDRLRQARAHQRLAGKRAKKAKEAGGDDPGKA